MVAAAYRTLPRCRERLLNVSWSFAFLLLSCLTCSSSESIIALAISWNEFVAADATRTASRSTAGESGSRELRGASLRWRGTCEMRACALIDEPSFGAFRGGRAAIMSSACKGSSCFVPADGGLGGLGSPSVGGSLLLGDCFARASGVNSGAGEGARGLGGSGSSFSPYLRAIRAYSILRASWISE
eukprot:CAMPEP_0195629318 /NCGR_PEP_ID=MMETSP0815-20121206/19929_1 /TAXON_ID=97485 /ORGANISM="Prymnesium parvum, Strain Texoma1" /LENGTH=185 /DNA_ID=CAMNT_0040770667 /DNA_START=209 /DNA_END=763 /DNA_ORIENTATION=+